MYVIWLVVLQFGRNKAHCGQDATHLAEAELQAGVIGFEVILVELHVLQHADILFEKFAVAHAFGYLELLLFRRLLKFLLLFFRQLFALVFLLGLNHRVQLG